jgi:hypothetical protein
MEKKSGYKGSTGDGSIPYMSVFFAIREGIGKLVELL